MDTAVVLVSGGVNSLVATGVADREYALALMHASYGQRTGERELASFNKICQHFAPARQLVVSLPHMDKVGGSARLDKGMTIEDARALSESVANTYVPGLMPSLLGLAFNWASAIGARHIIVGTSENDGPPAADTPALFPDHRRDLYHLYNQLVEMTAKSSSRIQIHTPLIEMTRGEVIRLGQHVKVPFELSWSCDRRADAPCATCYGCVSRAQGFVDAAVTDPIMIEDE